MFQNKCFIDMYQITKTRKDMNSNRDHPKSLTSFMDGPLLNYWIICCRLSSSQDLWDAWVSQVAIFLPKLKMSFQTSFLTRPQTNGSMFIIRQPTKWLLRYVMFGSNSICYLKHSIFMNRYLFTHLIIRTYKSYSWSTNQKCLDYPFQL